MKVIIEIERPTGTVELVDVSVRFPNGMSHQLLTACREQTQKAGRGYIRRIVEGEIDQNPQGTRRYTSAMAYGYRDEEQRRYNQTMRQDLAGE